MITLISIIIICLTTIIIVVIKNLCKHEYHKVDEEKMWNDNRKFHESNDDSYMHRWVVLQCKKCGNIKVTKIC